jgi:hypothetical protein
MRQFMVEVWGELACFTRPEAKVERLSYPVDDAVGGPRPAGQHLLQV